MVKRMEQSRIDASPVVNRHGIFPPITMWIPTGSSPFNGLLPISWSSDNGSHLVVHSVDEGSGGSSSIGTYLSQVAENSAGVRYPRELCGRSVLYSPFQSAPNARACGSLSNSSRSRNSSRTLLWNDSA